MYKSKFLPETEIDINNYLTELLIFNFLKFTNKPIPQSPFWRKDIKNNNEYIHDLAERYTHELMAVKELLMVFQPAVLASYFEKNGIIGFKRVKKETQEKILRGLYLEQIKYLKQLKKDKGQEIKTSTQEYSKKKSRKKTSIANL